MRDDEQRLALRALRRNSTLRRRVNKQLFAKLLPLYYPNDHSEIRDALLSAVNAVNEAPEVRFVVS